MQGDSPGAVAALRAAPRTEQRSPRTADIDTVPTEEVLRLLNAEDATVPGAVASALPVLATVVDKVVECVRAGGQVHYFGAGTSGRMAVLDAAEIVPTFGLDPNVFIAHHAGGDRALGSAIEDAEDDSALGAQDAGSVTAGDVAVGITASGRTPYVAGALRAARLAGAGSALGSSNPGGRPPYGAGAVRGAGLAGGVTVVVRSNPVAPIPGLADYVVVADTGPEAIAGSTRLKAATAQKLLLNALSTAAMVRLGRTYSNLMVSLSGANAKLRGRQLRILVEVSGADEAACRSQLALCGGDLRLALLCLLSGLEPDAAAKALGAASGSVRAALAGQVLPTRAAFSGRPAADPEHRAGE